MASDLRIAVICSSNQNRSMEAHNFLAKKGFNVRSFGSGNAVKLPGLTMVHCLDNVSTCVNCRDSKWLKAERLLFLGSAPDKPNIYDFSTTYHEMYQDLAKKDKSLYTQNGILHMLDRNRRIKPRPER